MEIRPNDEIEEFILQSFEDNYNVLKEQGGHALSPEVRQLAMMEVIYYWRRLKEVALNVTETEVKLSLPDQLTPKKKKFTIEGIVDIVRGVDKTVMYDIKTQEPEFLKPGNNEDYVNQLEVYAHIWENLREEKLDEVAIIATTFSKIVREEISKIETMEELDAVLLNSVKWDPIIHVDLSKKNVEKTIREFGEIVDCIEDCSFEPISKEEINENVKGTKTKVATWMCRNCDVRFSCSSYRAYLKVAKMEKKNRIQQFFCDNGTTDEIDERVSAGLPE